jgi:hypothetical protein
MIESRPSFGHALDAFRAQSFVAFLEAIGRGNWLPTGKVKHSGRSEKHWVLKWVVIQLSGQLRFAQSIQK